MIIKNKIMEHTQNNYGVPVNTKSLLAFIFNQIKDAVSFAAELLNIKSIYCL